MVITKLSSILFLFHCLLISPSYLWNSSPLCSLFLFLYYKILKSDGAHLQQQFFLCIFIGIHLSFFCHGHAECSCEKMPSNRQIIYLSIYVSSIHLSISSINITYHLSISSTYLFIITIVIILFLLYCSFKIASLLIFHSPFACSWPWTQL
jgi:hypothetical protein